MAGFVVYGFRVLAGKAGSIEIIRVGDPSRAAPISSPPDSASGRRSSFGGVRWFHIVVALVLPILALPWGVFCILREKYLLGCVLIGLSIIRAVIFGWGYSW
jgi:hypothetical protein